MAKIKRKITVLEAFNELIVSLTRRKRWWTPAERRLYNDLVRSISRSVLRKEAQRA